MKKPNRHPIFGIDLGVSDKSHLAVVASDGTPEGTMVLVSGAWPPSEWDAFEMKKEGLDPTNPAEYAKYLAERNRAVLVTNLGK